MTKQELLQKRAKAVNAQQEVLNNAAGVTASEQSKAFDKYQQEIEEIDAQLKMLQQHEDNAQKSHGGSAFVGGMPVGGVAADGKKDNGGFASLGEFLHAVKFGDPQGRLEALKAQNIGDNASGGYLVPPQLSDELLRIGVKESFIRPYATVIPADPNAPDATVNMPALDYSYGAEGGVGVNWIEEGGEKPETSAKFVNIELTPHEVAAHIVVTDSLLRNAPAAGVLFNQLLGNAIIRAEDRAFINGDGVKKPLGYANALNRGALIVKRTTVGQIQTADIANMLASFPAEDIPDARWIASNTVLPQLLQLKDGSGKLVFGEGDIAKGIPATLYGIPLEFTGMNAALGNTGDLQLVNLRKYLIKDGSGIIVSMSEHALFTQNKTVIKAFRTVDGKPWVLQPYMLDNGTMVSPYVLLGTTTTGANPITDLKATVTGNNVALTFGAATNALQVNVLRSADGITYTRINEKPLTAADTTYNDSNVPEGNYGYKLAVIGGDKAGVSNVATAEVTAGGTGGDDYEEE